MTKLFALLLACTTLSCGIIKPDPRSADIVVKEYQLKRPAYAAAQWWTFATRGDVDFQVVGTCRPGRWCTTVSLQPLLPEALGNCLSGFDWSRIYLDVTITEPSDQEQILAHEFGHALGLPHVDEPSDLMKPTGRGFSCIGTGTQGNYFDRYGLTNLIPVCGPGDGLKLPMFGNTL